MRQTAWIAVVFLLGTTLGPVILAAVAAALPSSSPSIVSPKSYEIGRLVSVYREQLPPGRLFDSELPMPDGAECGYDPEKLFPQAWDEFRKGRLAGNFTYYEGYFALDRWRYNNEDIGFISAINERLGKKLTRFEAGFLRRCIQSTLFSSQCMAKVEALGSSVKRYDSKQRNFALAGDNEDRVVCLYADGVAARRGLPLAPPFTQEYANSHRTPW